MRATELQRELLDEMAVREGAVRILWHVVPTRRQEFADELWCINDGLALLPLILRVSRFNDPNAIFSDIAITIDESRDCIESRFQSISVSPRKYCFVILAKRELRHAQISSPVPFPVWLPGIGGKLIDCCIENLGESVLVEYNHDVADISEIMRLLLEIELSMRALIRQRFSCDSAAGAPLFALLRRKTDSSEDLGALVNLLPSYVRSSGAVESFRPLAGDGESLIGRLVGICTSRSPDQLLKEVVPALRKVLVSGRVTLEDTSREYSAIGRLCRAAQKNRDPIDNAIQNGLSTIYAAYNLLTLAAHAGDYENVPIAVLRAMSYDVQRGLRSVILLIQNEREAIDRLDVPATVR